MKLAPLVVLAAANTAFAGIRVRILGSTKSDNSLAVHDEITFSVFHFCQTGGYKGNDLQGHYPATETQFTYYCCVADNIQSTMEFSTEKWWANVKPAGECDLDAGNNF
ncbi:hypothetical protein E4U54_003663 [Claviceps lovelessii]|nr:hypothetical protein E4U54_003663 [Claviceps lovelessii]